jgi:hypothetical protein
MATARATHHGSIDAVVTAATPIPTSQPSRPATTAEAAPIATTTGGTSQPT